jgi:hypothetical protein
MAKGECVNEIGGRLIVRDPPVIGARETATISVIFCIA